MVRADSRRLHLLKVTRAEGLFVYDDHGTIDVMAHVTGGIGGYLFGTLFLKRARQDAQGVQMTLDRANFKPRFF